MKRKLIATTVLAAAFSLVSCQENKSDIRFKGVCTKQFDNIQPGTRLLVDCEKVELKAKFKDIEQGACAFQENGERAVLVCEFIKKMPENGKRPAYKTINASNP